VGVAEFGLGAIDLGRKGMPIGRMRAVDLPTGLSGERFVMHWGGGEGRLGSTNCSKEKEPKSGAAGSRVRQEKLSPESVGTPKGGFVVPQKKKNTEVPWWGGEKTKTISRQLWN